MVARYSLTSGLFSLDEESAAKDDLAATLESIAAAGFSETELMAEGEEWQRPGPHDAGPCRRALERWGIYPHTIHTPMTDVNLASSIEAIRRDSVARIGDAMRFLGEVGGRTAIVHPTGHPTPEEQPLALENRGAAVERSHRSVSELVAVAAETGVRIALENLGTTRSPHRPLPSMQELRAFIAGFPPEHVGLCLDAGHACISGLDPAEQARVASERLYALHIQDVDGKSDCHWVPGRGVIDWSALGEALAAIDFDGAWTIEAMTGGTEATAEQVAAECTALSERWEAGGMSNPGPRG